MYRRLIQLSPSFNSSTKRSLAIVSKPTWSSQNSPTNVSPDEKSDSVRPPPKNEDNSLGQLKSKPLKNEPFIKNLFRGRYIFDYLKFPEFTQTSEVEKLENVFLGPIREYLSTNSGLQTGVSFIPEALKSFAHLGLFSQSLAREHGGLELDAASVARVLEECASCGHASLAAQLIYSNEVATRSIQHFGDEKQREKYLRRLAAGELRAGFGYSELRSGIDASRFELTATRSTSDKFVINGSKCWVSLLSSTTPRANNADFVLVVVAKTIEAADQISQTAFIVDASTPGVELRRLPIEGANLFEVEFKSVQVSASENVLGGLGAGHDVMRNVGDMSRFLVGAVCLGLLKRMLAQVVDYCTNTERFGKVLSEHLVIKNRLSILETRLYAIESVVYFTAGILDSFETPDASCESALAKIFCTEALRASLNDCLDLMGMSAYESAGNELSYHSNVTANLLANMLTNNEVLRQQIATSGVVLCGMEFGEHVAKYRNPFMFPSFIFKQIFSTRRLIKSMDKKLPEHFFLWEHVHPSLNEQAAHLEQCAVRLMLGTKGALVSYGRDLSENEIALRHLADIALQVYVLNAVVARASRSYSIGLKYANHDLTLAHFQSLECLELVKSSYTNLIEATRGLSFQNLRINVADRVIKSKGHAAEHSLTRNY